MSTPPQKYLLQYCGKGYKIFQDWEARGKGNEIDKSFLKDQCDVKFSSGIFSFGWDGIIGGFDIYVLKSLKIYPAQLMH